MAAGMDYKAIPDFTPKPTEKQDTAQDHNNQNIEQALAQIKKILEDIDSRLNAGGL
jgi:hypothetical protein